MILGSTGTGTTQPHAMVASMLPELMDVYDDLDTQWAVWPPL